MLRRTLNNPKARNLVFKGGSVKGTVFVGVRAALEKFGFDFAHVLRVGGASAGALTALFFALNIDAAEMKQLLMHTDFKDFLDDRTSVVNRDDLFKFQKAKKNKQTFFSASQGSSLASSAASQMSATMGIFDGEYLRVWVDSLIFHKTKIRHCTFAEFEALRKDHPEYKSLYVVGYNLNEQLAHTFSYETTPDVPISDAIRLSTAIPLFFTPHILHHKIGNVRQPDPTGHFWVDGAMAENYPINLFDNERYLEQGGDQPIFNRETWGFSLTGKKKKDYLSGLTEQPPTKSISTFMPYAKAVMNARMHTEFNAHVRGHDRERTIYIDPLHIGTLDFDLTVQDQLSLIQSGWDAVCEHFGVEPSPLPDFLTEVEETEEKTTSSENCLVM